MTMTTERESTALTVTQNGQPWEPKTTEILAAYPEREYNLLVPTVQVRQVNPFLVPDIEVVQLTEDDIYHSNDMAAGQHAPNARGLAKLAQVAGISTVDSRRVDDGKDPDIVTWRVDIEMTTPSGRTVRGTGNKTISIHQLAESTNRDGQKPSAARINKAREHLHAMAETKAFNRAVRALLSMHGSYAKERLLKPFAVLRYVPDMSQPEVRQAFLGQLAPAAQAVFGPPETPAAQSVPQIETAPEAPEEDEAPTTPEGVTADGEVEPDWSKPTEAKAEDDATAEPKILVNLRDRAAASKSKKDATDSQREALKATFRGLGMSPVMTVLGHLWHLDNPGSINETQAHAILDEAEARGRTFQADWQEAAEWIDRSMPE